jgi:hypothetical protein
MDDIERRRFGPADGTGRTWDDVLRENKEADAQRRKAKLLGRDPDDVSDDEVRAEPVPEVFIAAHEVESGWPSVITTWRNRLLANDWKFKVGHSAAHNPDTYWQNGNLRKAAHDVHMWWINAIKDGRYITISYALIDGKTAWSSRTVRGVMKLQSDAYMREIVESSDE